MANPENVVVVDVRLEPNIKDLQKTIKRLEKSGADVTIGKNLNGGKKAITARFKKIGQTLNTGVANVEKSLKAQGDPYAILRASSRKGKAPKPIPSAEDILNKNIQKSLPKIGRQTGKLPLSSIKSSLMSPEKDAKIAQASQNAQTKYNYAVKNSMDRETKRRAAIANENSLRNKGNKFLKAATKQTFMLQMGMLGVAFSTQSLISSFQSLGMAGLAGIADTETAIKNMVLSDTFAGTSFMKNLDMNEFIKNSKLAEGALAGLQSIIVDITNKVLTDPETKENIKNAIITLVEELTKPEFIAAVKGIVDAITSKDFITNMTNAALAIANLTKSLGEGGLLDEIIYVIIACQLLMPVFAALQLILLLISSGVAAATVGAFILIGIVVLFVIGTIMNVINEFGKYGNIFQAIIFGLIDSVGAVADVIGGLLHLIAGVEYHQGDFTRNFKSMAAQTYGFKYNPEEYDTKSKIEELKNAGNTTYNVTFNKNVTSQQYSEIMSAIKSNQTKSIT